MHLDPARKSLVNFRQNTNLTHRLHSIQRATQIVESLNFEGLNATISAILGLSPIFLLGDKRCKQSVCYRFWSWFGNLAGSLFIVWYTSFLLDPGLTSMPALFDGAFLDKMPSFMTPANLPVAIRQFLPI